MKDAPPHQREIWVLQVWLTSPNFPPAPPQLSSGLKLAQPLGILLGECRAGVRIIFEPLETSQTPVKGLVIKLSPRFGAVLVCGGLQVYAGRMEYGPHTYMNIHATHLREPVEPSWQEGAPQAARFRAAARGEVAGGSGEGAAWEPRVLVSVGAEQLVGLWGRPARPPATQPSPSPPGWFLR